MTMKYQKLKTRYLYLLESINNNTLYKFNIKLI